MLSGIDDIAYTPDFEEYFKKAVSECENICLDIDDTREERDYTEAHRFARRMKEEYPAKKIVNIRPALAEIRTIKADCEIDACKFHHKYP